MDNLDFFENLHELLKNLDNEFDFLLLTPKLERNRIENQKNYFITRLDINI